MRPWFQSAAVLALSLATCLAASAHYSVVARYPVGGVSGYDFITVDSQARRVYASHSAVVEVVDADTGKLIGKIQPNGGLHVHGIAIAREFNHGFTANGLEHSVTMVDLSTLQPIRTIRSPELDPDAIEYDPETKRVLVCDARLGAVTFLDAKTGDLIRTLKIGGKLEQFALDGAGRVYVTGAEKGQIHAINTRTMTLVSTWPVAPGEDPSGLAIDRVHRRLFATCGNGVLVVLDADTGKVVATPPIGEDPDGAVFDPDSLRVLVPSKAGTLAVIQETSPDSYSVVETVPTQFHAATIAFDPKTHRAFLPAATFGKAPAPTKESPQPKQPVIDDTFTILAVGEGP